MVAGQKPWSCSMEAKWVEPESNQPSRVSLSLFKAGGLAAVGAGEALRQNLLRRHLKPGVGALLLEQAGDGVDGLVGADGLAAVLAVEHGDGQAPAALAADAPVGALPDHGAASGPCPRRAPSARRRRRRTASSLKDVHGAEPLGSGPEDDGLLAAPAVGIAVDDLLAGKERAALLHIRQDDGVGLLGLHPGVLAGVVGVAALIVHRHHHIHAVAQAGLIVVGTEAGGGVDAAGTGVHGDVVRQHQTAGLGQEGVVRPACSQRRRRGGSPRSRSCSTPPIFMTFSARASAMIYISPSAALTTA